MRRRTIALLRLVVLICLPYGRALGSAPPRIVRAATSSNGKFLVISSYELGSEGPGGGRPILSNTFEISRREPFDNPRHSLSSPNSYYYADFGWKVVLPARSGLANPWPIVSDDGLTLVPVSVTAAMDHQILLAIYRKQQDGGSLVRFLKREDLFFRKPNEPSIVVIWDSTPTWFAAGDFSFSKDGASLFYKDREHGQAKLNLTDGTVTHVH